MKTRVRNLAYFVAAAEHRSTTAAAKALNISQPSISLAICELEDILGQALFLRRNAKGLDLTPFGVRKLIEARRLLSELESFELSPLDGDGANLRGILVIAYMTTVGPLCLAGILRLFRDRHPQVVIHLKEGDLRETRERIAGGAAELAITYDIGIGAAAAREILAEWQPYALIPADHRLAERSHVTLREIGSEPLILFGLPDSREFWLTALEQAGVSPTIAFEVSSMEMVRSMVANHHGLAIMTARPAGDFSYDGKPLACIPLTSELVPQKVIALIPDPQRMSRLAQAFMDCAREHFRKQPPDPGRMVSITELEAVHLMPE